MRHARRNGFSFLETVMALVVAMVLVAVMSPKIGDTADNARSTGAKARVGALGTGFAAALTNGIASNPANPFPTLISLADSTSEGIFPLAIDGSGICVDSGVKLATFIDSGMGTPTSKSSDAVKALAPAAGADPVNCPGSDSSGGNP
jgi:hypothetical protein